MSWRITGRVVGYLTLAITSALFAMLNFMIVLKAIEQPHIRILGVIPWYGSAAIGLVIGVLFSVIALGAFLEAVRRVFEEV